MSKEKNDYYFQYQRNNAHNKAVKARNPCAKENEISMKCLDRNNYIKELCEKEFENYKICKKFWYYVAQDRRSKGLPLQMTEEDKQKAKEDFAKEIAGKAEILQKRNEEYKKFREKFG
ncbi:hypothetical protein M8J75_013507 [Diaphorina citri]|nr:hypothetical protein M8J75_013507 [Diaphorina citri]